MFIVRSKDRGHIVALWVSCFQMRPRLEQLGELEEQYKDWTMQQKLTLLERPSRGRACVERTPHLGIPVVVPKQCGVFSHKRLRKFQEDLHISLRPIPRPLVDSLARAEFDRSWLQLSTRQRLGLLDMVVYLHAGREAAA